MKNHQNLASFLAFDIAQDFLLLFGPSKSRDKESKIEKQRQSLSQKQLQPDAVGKGLIFLVPQKVGTKEKQN